MTARDVEALGRLTSALGEPSGRLTPTEDFCAAPVRADVEESEGGVARPGGFRGLGRSPKVAREARSLSYLDTLGITRPPPINERDEAWLDAIGEVTKDHREARARRFDEEAARRERAARADGVKGLGVVRAGAWHRSRARGARRRIETVKGCRRESILSVVCETCGIVHEKMCRCSVGLLCVSCRGKRARTKRGGFARARQRLLGLAREASLLRHDRPGGRWSEKLMTLTVPQLRHVTIEERIRRVRAAWPRLLKALNTFLGRFDAKRLCAWFRNIEWTPGADGLGHPHIHVWIFSRFVPRDLIIEWWRAALMKSGYTGHELRILMTDIREVKNGETAALEVIKYLTKDRAADGTKINAETYGAVVNALEGVRTTQGSRGFLGLAGVFKAACPCGALECFFVCITRVDTLVSRDTTHLTRAGPGAGMR